MSITAARNLWHARLNNQTLARDFEGYPASEDEAFAIQTAMIEESGLPVVGWKLGATVAASLPVIGIERPFIGPLFERFCHGDGAALAVLPGQVLETEFTVRLKSDLPYQDEPYGAEELGAAIGALVPSFEIVGIRFEGGIPGAGHRLVADGGVNVATVLGSEITEWEAASLADHEVSLSVNGENAAAGKPADLIWDDLVAAVGWLAVHPHMAGRGLLAGDLIMTGSMTGMTPIHPGDQAEADFGAMGSIRVSFT